MRGLARRPTTVDQETEFSSLRQVGDLLRQDAVWMPFYQLPLITAWDTAQVAGPVGEYTDRPLSGFYNVYDRYLAT